MEGEIPYNEAHATAYETNGTMKGPAQAQATDVPHGDALKTDDVIELQAFLERRTWIESKIQLFEKMAVIDVYAGSESLVTRSSRVVGLPTKEQLDVWIHEMDTIESETEQFDQGDMIRLKDFAKAKSEQNLSPQDTDLIEVTLTTLLAVDKLLHLLRSRSETLDMLGLRLHWEDQRIAAWDARSQLLHELKGLSEHALWDTSVYDPLSAPAPSTSTLAQSEETIRSPESMFPYVLSMPARSARRKLAEALVAEARGLTSRVTSYKRDILPRPGVTLDKMIETSSTKVPDLILDEQDKLENDSKVFDGLDKFIPTLQMQWKKADEFYAELMKDQATAHILLDEIAKARAQHPTSALDQSFTSRSTALSSRLSAIGHPSTIIPRPRHPLVPEQVASNEKIHEILSSELAIAIKLSRKAQLKAKEYHTIAHAVERVTSLSTEAVDLSLHLERFSDRLKNGSVVPDGNGTPPDLADDRCLHPTQHGSYIALLPSLLKEINATDVKARKNIGDLRSVLLELRTATLLPSFSEDALQMVEKLSAQLKEVEEAKKNAMQDVDVLRRARGIWTRTTDAISLINAVRTDITNAMESHQWAAALGRDGAPLTPDSPRTNSEAVVLVTPGDANSRIASIESILLSEVQDSLAQLSPSLPPVLLHHLQTDSNDASAQIEDLRDLVRVWGLARSQSDTMRNVLAETYELEGKVDSLREEIQQSIDQTLREPSWNNDPTRNDAFASRVGDLRLQVTNFTASMASRVPFISSTGSALPHKRSFSISSALPNAPQAAITRSHNLEALQRKIAALDQVVRNDANALAMSLGASMDALRRKLDLFSLAELARLLDSQVSSASRAMQTATEQLGEKMSLCDYLLSTIENSSPPESQSQEQMDLDQQFAQLLTNVDQMSTEHLPILLQAIDTAQSTLRLMRSSPGAHDASVHDDMLNRRSRTFEDIEARAQAFQRDVASLRTKLVEGRRQAEQQAHERRLLEEREEMLRRGSLSKAELEASQRALQESELKAQTAIEEHRRRWEAEHQASSETGDDVFGNFEAGPSESKLHPLHAQIAAIRIELRSIGINAAARPVSDSPDTSIHLTLATLPQAQTMRGRLNVVVAAFEKLPSRISDSTLLGELKSLKFEIDASHPLLARVEHLAMFASGVDHCDAALSDLLEHLDTFPSLPVETASPYVPDPSQSPMEQLKSRLEFCQRVMTNLHTSFEMVADYERVKDEKMRLEQTWAELADMAKDKTRPATRPTSTVSVRSTMMNTTNTISSSSAASRPLRSSARPTPPLPPRIERSRLRTTSSSTSQSPMNKQFFTAPRQPSSRPPTMTHSRNSSRMSNRSVSGPSTTTSSTLSSSTYSSRQRTNSTASTSVPPIPATPVLMPRPRMSNNPTSSAPSPTPSAIGSKPPTIRPPSRPPRASLPGSGAATPRTRRSTSVASDRPKPPRRSYVANPQNKLDVAVGAVMNKLPAEVHIEAIPTAWQDESGKYWIGDSDPKLCFCRILRSQTVMVRVGGGWVELSKFIRDHFAHLFRIDPTTPPKTHGGPSEEKWISAATLLESSSERSPSVQGVRPITPLVRAPLLVPASGSSQGAGRSPPGIPLMHHSPGSSPLTPMHFIRRASVEPPSLGPMQSSSKPHNPPATPAMKATSSATHLMTPTPSRPPVWR